MIKTLYELYNLIEKVSTALPNVNQFVNSFDSLNREDTSYAAVVLQFRDGTQATEGSVRYRFYLGYVDRVNENTDTPSTSNNILTQSIAEENIRLIINKLYPEVDITFGNTFYPFTQRFAALTAGCYVELAITLAVKDCNYESGSVLRDVEIVSDSNGVKEVVPGSGVDGFKKVIVRTEVPLKEEVEKDIVITENGNTMLVPEEGQSFSKVNIDVNVPQGDIEGMKYANSVIEEFPSYFKFAPRTGDSCIKMFQGCKNLKNAPYVDISNANSTESMFISCDSLISIPLLDTGKVTDMTNMFNSCTSLTTIPLLNTSNVTDMTNMFRFCTSLTSIPQLDTHSVRNMNSMFAYCSNLESVPLLDTSHINNHMTLTFNRCSNLKNLGGFRGLFNDLDLHYCNQLTHDSLMNVINEVADETGSSITHRLTLGDTNLAKLTDEEKAIATNKGWTLS